MSTDNNEVRKQLMAAREAAAEVYRPLRGAAIAHVERVLNNWLGRQPKFPGYIGASVRSLDADDYTILIKTDPHDRIHEINLRYNKPWRDDKRMLRLNVSGHGCVSAGELEVCGVIALTGSLARDLVVIEAEMASFDWAALERAELEVWRATSQIECHDRDVKAAEHAAKMEAARNSLAAKAVITYKSRYSKSERAVAISSVTPKYVFLENYVEGKIRYDKDDVAARIVNGEWKIAG